MSETFEEKAIALFDQHIDDLCLHRWQNIEPEDRKVEALLVFCYALRTFPLQSGHFWKSFTDMLIAHMDEVNRKTPSLRFSRVLSLDQVYRATNLDSGVTLMDFLSDTQQDETQLYVQIFIESLPAPLQRLLCLLLNETPVRQILSTLGCTPGELRRMKHAIAQLYTVYRG